MLTICEASVYFNIGEKSMRKLVEENHNVFAFKKGSRYVIVRHLFEEYIDKCVKGEKRNTKGGSEGPTASADTKVETPVKSDAFVSQSQTSKTSDSLTKKRRR